MLKRGVLVGETTGGGANPGGPRQLGHGFVVGKPDIAVPASEALATAHRAALARRPR